MMHRQMQNLSFLVIVGVLLGCAFFFSRLSKHDSEATDVTDAPVRTQTTLTDIPDCDIEGTTRDIQRCYYKAVEISDRLVAAIAENILVEEHDQDRRAAFTESQTAWEGSRAADCAYVREMNSDVDQEAIKESVCLRDRNLARYAQLEQLMCEWYPAVSCGTANTSID